MGGDVTEEKAISRAQYLDLVYSQSGTLYDLIPRAPRPTTDPSRPTVEPPIDGILSSVQTQMEAKYSKKQTQTTTPSNQLNLLVERRNEKINLKNLITNRKEIKHKTQMLIQKVSER